MIKALSPYYITIPWVAPLSGDTATQFTLNIYVWNGLKSAVPTTVTYQVIKDNSESSTGNIKINIANWIADFIDFTAQEGTTTELIDGNNQYWIKWETFYITDTPTDATTPSNVNTKLFLRGYSYGMEGENATTPANKILIPIQDYKVSVNSKFVVPIVIDETTVTLATLTIDNITLDSGDQYDLEFSSTGNIDEVYFRYRLQPATSWTVGFESSFTSPFTITLPTTYGTYDVQIFAYDNDNGVNVYSNIFNVVVP